MLKSWSEQLKFILQVFSKSAAVVLFAATRKKKKTSIAQKCVEVVVFVDVKALQEMMAL